MYCTNKEGLLYRYTSKMYIITIKYWFLHPSQLMENSLCWQHSMSSLKDCWSSSQLCSSRGRVRTSRVSRAARSGGGRGPAEAPPCLRRCPAGHLHPQRGWDLRQQHLDPLKALEPVKQWIHSQSRKATKNIPGYEYVRTYKPKFFQFAQRYAIAEWQ